MIFFLSYRALQRGANLGDDGQDAIGFGGENIFIFGKSLIFGGEILILYGDMFFLGVGCLLFTCCGVLRSSIDGWFPTNRLIF